MKVFVVFGDGFKIICYTVVFHLSFMLTGFFYSPSSVLQKGRSLASLADSRCRYFITAEGPSS
jgi:hypothetical protein